MKKLYTSLLLIFVSFGFFLSGCDNSGYTSPNEQKVLLISIDGFMNEYLDRNETPNLDYIIANGVKAEYLEPVFPTKTFPNHWSQVTGLKVENHGIISNSFPDDSLGGRFSYGPPEDSPNDERWWGGEPIWVTAETQGKTAATMFWPGSEASINGVRPTRWVDYDGSLDNYARVDSVITWLDSAGNTDADFATLYFSHVDSRGHRYGPNSPEVDEAVVEADNLIGYLLEQMEEKGLTGLLNVLIVSDHGMAELSEDKIIFLDELIDLDDVSVIDWNPVAMLQPAEGRKEAVYNTLKENEENYRVFYRDEMPEKYGFSGHYRIPEIIMIADVSYSITSRSFFEDRGIIAGTHGYDHTTPEMATIFYASGPDIKQGETVPAFSVLDLYGLMAKILKIEPAPNDGDINSVMGVLR